MGSVRLCHTNSEFQRKNSVQFNNFIIKKVGLEGLENYKTLVSRSRPFGQDQDPRLSAQDQDFFFWFSRRLKTKTMSSRTIALFKSQTISEIIVTTLALLSL